MKKLLLLLPLILLFSGIVQANGQALPPLPHPDIINQVISQTSGLPFIPLGAPHYVSSKLSTFTGVFAGVQAQLDTGQTIHYIKVDGQLTESVLPLIKSGKAKLKPDIIAPGTDPRHGKIVGALLQPARVGREVMVMVAIFKSNKPKERPEKIRFYYNSTEYEEYSVIWGKFKNGKDKQDDGALIAQKYSCVTVGKQQVCWEPYDHNLVRDEPTAKNIAYEAYTQFKSVYHLGVDFYVDDAVPDLVGITRRTSCAAALPQTTVFTSLPDCKPNLVFTSAKDRLPGQPLGVFVVLEEADIRTYRASDGVYIGSLPAGKYLVMDASPDVKIKGSIAALFLVNLDTVNHYLIPSRVIAGFSESSAIVEPQAAIKDGYLWSRSFGYP